MDAPPPTEYRSKQFTAIPDVGASVRKWAAAQAGRTPADELVAAFLAHLVAPRVSVFTLLARPTPGGGRHGLPAGGTLGQTFSLDNGMVLQALVMHWLAHFRAPKRARGQPAPEPGALGELKRDRQARAVWWEARVVRVWTWPEAHAAELVRLCRAVLAAVAAPCPDAPCAAPRHTVAEAEDICAACTRALYAELAADYKCVALQAAA